MLGLYLLDLSYYWASLGARKEAYFVSTRDWLWLETGHRSGGWSFCYLVSIYCSWVLLKWLSALNSEGEMPWRAGRDHHPWGCASSEYGAQSPSCVLPMEKAWDLLLVFACICYSCEFESFPLDHKFVARELGRCLVLCWPWPTD